MELVLTRQSDTQVAVTCDGEPSHSFDLRTLIPNDQKTPPHPLDDSETYGRAIYAALFPAGTLALRQLQSSPQRILLVLTDNQLDTIPWEYAYGPYGSEDTEDFLVKECHLVRGLPAEQRIAPPELKNSPHIVAVPSNPLSKTVEPLNIEGEWMRLREAIDDKELQCAITLERTRPPTLERVGLLVANQQQRIVHFMGHGGQDEKVGAILCFEKDNGDLDPVTAKDFMRQVRGTVFLVTLNACVSATPGETHLSNLVAALVRQKTPYALGMRFSIPDDDALTFSRTFYSYLARGSSVEEAVYRVRLALARSQRQWMIGVPVLYTSLSAPATGFASIPGTPEIKEHQPRIEVSILPRAEGTFQGRIEDVKQLGDYLTGDKRKRIVTIHGGGGQGKTSLAREAVERFAYAWPAGVWATTLENLPSREVFTSDLARFLGIAIDPASEPAQLERQVLRQLNQRRTLIVLDNAETLVDAVEARDALAIRLAEFIKQLPGSTVSLLVTSRVQLGWPEEVSLELGGLSPEEGAALFRQSAPQRTEAVALALAQQLSQKVDGHPLSLRLLGGAFNASAISLPVFLAEYEAQLAKAENKYVGEHHRQRTLYASIETSVRYLDEEHRHLLSGLWLFYAPFLPETAGAIFDPQTGNIEETEKAKRENSPIYDRLHTLWRRGLLNRETVTVREGTILFYRLPPTMRPYVEKFLVQTDERETLLARFGAEYAQLVRFLYRELNRGGIAASMALMLRDDFERGASCVTGVEQGYYWLQWGWILLKRLGDWQHGLKLTGQALEVGQEQDKDLKLQTLNNMAAVYDAIGQPRRALEVFEQALPIRREGGDRAGEAATLNGMAYLYQTMQRYTEARATFEQSITLEQKVSHRAGEVAGLFGLALLLYQHLDSPQEAISKMEQALAVLVATGLPQDAAGHTTEQVQQYLEAMRQGIPFGRSTQEGRGAGGPSIAGVSNEIMQAMRDFVNADDWEATRHVLETQREVLFRPEVETLFEQNIAQAQASGNQRATELLELYLSVLRDCKTRGIAETFKQIEAAQQMSDQLTDLPFDIDLIPRSIEALSGGPPERMQHMQYLAAQASQATDEGLKALINTIQLALFGSPLAQLGQNLDGMYQQAWAAIVEGVEKAGGTSS